MSRDPAVCYEDALAAAEEILVLTAGLDFAEFPVNRAVYLAVEHCLLIVGEALSRVPQETRLLHPDVPWSDIIGLRNLIVHAYFRIDPAILWRIVREDVPALVPVLRAKLPGS